MTGHELWEEFYTFNRSSSSYGFDLDADMYSAWSFGDNPDTLADLVLRGLKTATSSAEPMYEVDHEPLPQPGEFAVILDSRDEAVCVILTTRVYVTPYREVSAEHAWLEGEGDRSLAYWRKVHKAFFTRTLQAAGLTFTEDMPVVCEEFRLVYPPAPTER